jgi:hypothetical protein
MHSPARCGNNRVSRPATCPGTPGARTAAVVAAAAGGMADCPGNEAPGCDDLGGSPRPTGASLPAHAGAPHLSRTVTPPRHQPQDPHRQLPCSGRRVSLSVDHRIRGRTTVFSPANPLHFPREPTLGKPAVATQHFFSSLRHARNRRGVRPRGLTGRSPRRHLCGASRFGQVAPFGPDARRRAGVRRCSLPMCGVSSDAACPRPC